jgi:VWFA-related protein
MPNLAVPDRVKFYVMRLSATLLPFALASLTWSQPQSPADPAAQQAPTFSVDVRLVNVAFSVRDATGAFVSGLKREDFDIFEDGLRQEIGHFSRDQDTPLSLGLIVDRSSKQNQLEGRNAAAAIDFLQRLLRPQDKALLVFFDNRLRLLHDFTSEATPLEIALVQSRGTFDSSLPLGPSEARGRGAATCDVVYWTTKEKFENLTGRKALVVIGGGEDSSSKRSVLETATELQSADVVLYGLNYGANSHSSSARANAMNTLCEQSGGTEFHVTLETLGNAFDKMETELRSLYSLAYSPSAAGQPGQFHRIEIRAKRNGLTVHSRPGYYAR